jgi:hypothetical protein
VHIERPTIAFGRKEEGEKKKLELSKWNPNNISG